MQLRRDLFHKGEDKHCLLVRQLYEYLQQNFPDSITPQMEKDAERYRVKTSLLR